MNILVPFIITLCLTLKIQYINGKPIGDFKTNNEVQALVNIDLSQIKENIAVGQQNDIKVPEKTVKDVLRKLIGENFDIKNLHKVGGEVFEYVDEKSKTPVNILRKGNGKHKPNRSYKKDKKLHRKLGKAAKDERKEMKVKDEQKLRAEHGKRKHNKNKPIEKDKPKVTTVKQIQTTSTSPTVKEYSTTKSTSHDITVKPDENEDEQDKHLQETLNSSTITTPSNVPNALLEPSLENVNETGETNKTDKIVTVKLRTGHNHSNKNHGHTKLDQTQGHQVSHYSSLPSFSSYKFTATSTVIPSFTSSAQSSSSSSLPSTISTSSIHITSSSSLSSLSFLPDISSSSLYPSKSSILISLLSSLSSPTTPPPSSSSLHLFNSSFTQPLTSSLLLNQLLVSSLTSSSSFPLLPSSSSSLQLPSKSLVHTSLSSTTTTTSAPSSESLQWTLSSVISSMYHPQSSSSSSSSFSSSALSSPNY